MALAGSYSEVLEHDELVRRASRAPDRGWMDLYFALIKRVLDATSLADDDPRLVLSLPVGAPRFPLTINTRYILFCGLGRQKCTVGFIYGPEYDLDQDLQNIISRKYEFSNNIRSVGAFQPAPYYLQLKNGRNLSTILDYEEGWLQAAIAEVPRYSSSPYRSKHRALVYKAAADLQYRAAVLDEAFSGRRVEAISPVAVFRGITRL